MSGGDWLLLAAGVLLASLVIGLVISGSMHLLTRRSSRRGAQFDDVAESIRKAERDDNRRRWGT